MAAPLTKPLTNSNGRDRWSELVDDQHAIVSRAIFADEEIYREELQRIFGRCWLFLAHETMLPAVGDYFTTYIGEDSVVVCRDQTGRVRAFLNTCPHRGNKVCLFDRGNTRTFTCSYHGWSFTTEGKLTGVPFFNEAYYGQIDRENLGLPEVPRVETYGGLVFGSWDAKAPPLDTYLGDLKWYLDTLYLASDSGGLEVIPGSQKYTVPGNWKIPSDNFHGDHYHTPYTHGSSYTLGLVEKGRTRDEKQSTQGRFEVALGPHGLGGLLVGEEQYELDLAKARELGAEVVEWVQDRYHRLQARLEGVTANPYGLSRGTIFPNFSFNGATSAFGPRGFYVWHPRGPLTTEAWQWCVVERGAPQVVKEMAVRKFSRGQSAAGFFGQDDAENFERVTEMTRSPLTQGLTFTYGMALEHDGRWPGMEHWEIEGLPGKIGPHIAEQNQRRFYHWWADYMREGGK